MPTRQEIISGAVKKARVDWLDYTIRQEKVIYKLCEDTAVMIEARIMRYVEQGKIPPYRLIAILGAEFNPSPSSVRGILRQLRPRFRAEMKKGVTQSVTFGMKSKMMGMHAVTNSLSPHIKIGIGTSFVGVDGVIRTYDVSKQLYAQSMWAKINADAVDFLMRTNYAGVTLSDRIWDITWDVEKSIRGRINTGILIGDAAERVARDIRPYLIRPDDRFHRVRKDGKLVLSKPARAYHPGRGVPRSAFARTRRVARTEMSRAYHEGAIRYAKQKNWIDGLVWHVGGAEPCGICEDLDGRFFRKDDIPGIPHPNCMCFTVDHVEGDDLPAEKEPMSPDTKNAILTAY